MLDVDSYDKKDKVRRSATVAPNKQMGKKELELKQQIDSVVLKNKEYLIYPYHDEVKVGRMVLWKMSANNKYKAYWQC